MESRRRGQFGALVGLMVASSFAEALSIGAVLPFLGALTQPSVVFDRPSGRAFAEWIGAASADQILFPMTCAFCLAIVVAGSARVVMVWASTRFSFALGSDLSNRVYRNSLHQPYTEHIARNSSEIINAIWIKVSEVIFFVLLPVTTLISAAIVIASVCAVLLLTVPKTALLAFGSLALVYFLIVTLVKTRLALNSRLIAEESTKLVKALQEGLGGIRDVLIDGSQATFSAEYFAINKKLRDAQGENQIIGQCPRYLIESLGMVLIAFLAYGMSRESNDISSTISTLAAIALSMQRLLPAAQQLYGGWSNIHGTQISLRDVLAMLNATPSSDVVAPVHAMSFDREIMLKDVFFRYQPQSPWILQGVDLKITKGARLGLVGSTGCGKSTLLDVVMGLLHPTRGSLTVDGVAVSAGNGRAWQAHIAHVPQTVFLADSSIAANIAFGVATDKIDHARVERVAEQAQLADVIRKWPLGYATRVGERGVQLSGGQRQRIGIARALYKNADVIVFDEATSALDGMTESGVIASIESLGKNITVLMIAHRLNTLRNCTEIIELDKGVVIDRRVGNSLKD